MTTMSLAEAKAHLSEVINRVSTQQERVTVSVHGRASAVLLAPEDLERLEETIAVLVDNKLLEALVQADQDVAQGRAESADQLADDARASRPVSSEQPYQLAITATARRALAEQLPEAIAFAAYEFITGPLLTNPQRIGKRLMPPRDDRHSARRGTYLVIYRINETTHTVTVLAVGPRADTHRPQ
jgi:mRNA interferase RelE/StbE